jgi:nucleoside-diphosphate-sugar epimerase
MKLFVFGLGYSALHFAQRQANAFESIAGTVRSADKAARLGDECSGLTPLVFDDDQAIAEHLAEADALLVSIAPETQDPVLARYGAMIAAAPNLHRIVYLSTIGVYGDHGGAWVDETTEPQPVSSRNRARVVAERAWLSLASDQRRVFVLRLAGIYGPGRSQIDNLREGTARRIVRPGQVFNRIHVEDISRAIFATLTRDVPTGIVNVTDDEPAPPQDVVTYAAQLLDMAPPPEIPFEQANFSPMALSFWGQNKRVANRRLREGLGVELACPTYREGLKSLL